MKFLFLALLSLGTVFAQLGDEAGEEQVPPPVALKTLTRLLSDSAWREKSPGREETIRKLAQCVAETRDTAAIENLLTLALARSDRWQQYAMLDGLASLIPQKGQTKEAPKPKPLHFPAEPPALAEFAALHDPGLQTRLAALQPLFLWPTKAGVPETEVKPLTEREKKLFDAGRAQYILVCGACHQPNGQGLEGLSPPLVDSDWTTGSPERLARIVLQGVRGPMNVNGHSWELEMPALNILTDEEIAGLATYVRREWGHTASPITPEFIAKVRKETEDRIEAWTEAELLKIK